MAISDGFPGQRMAVLPRPRVAEALGSPGTGRLLVTDCGYFPEASSHGRRRPQGVPQAVVLVCTEGRGWCEIDGVRHEVAAGRVVILPPGVPHAYGADDDQPWTLWWAHLAGRDLPELLEAAGPSVVREARDVFAVAALVQDALRRLERDTTAGSLLAAAGAAWHLLAELAADRTAEHGRGDALEQAAAYLREHLAEHIEVAELAAMARLSPSHFAALFRRHYGAPVLQYQTQVRMARARTLLDTTDQPIPRIAASVGYPDSFYFSRQFRRVHGVPPTRYRALGKG